MSPVISTDVEHRSRPRLRLVDGENRRRFAEGRSRSATVTQPPAPSVLVAGADASRRAKMLGELRGLLPQGTPFVEACETWQVIARAPDSQMAILTGDLDDISARGLMRVLGRRHPLLPVIALDGIALDGQRRPVAPDHVGDTVAPGNAGAASL